MDTGGFVLFDGSVVPGVGSCEVEGGGGAQRVFKPTENAMLS